MTVDNPLFASSDVLTQRQDGMGHDSFEEVVRSDSTARATVTYRDIAFGVSSSGGDATKGSVEEELTVVPRPDNGLLAFEPGDTFPWEAHGMQVGYAQLDVNGFLTDAFEDSLSDPLLPHTVRLDPSVMLVPIQLVRVLPSPDVSGFDDLRAFAPATWRTVWDDVPRYSVFKQGEPNYPNALTVVSPFQFTDSDRPIEFVAPDSVWSQCGIQFREIDCGRDEGTGCPDLIVNDAAHVEPPECANGFLGGFAQVRDNWSNAQELPNVNGDLPVVITMETVSAPCPGGTPIDIAEMNRAAIAMAFQRTAPLVLSHELGHVLGLDDRTNCATLPEDQLALMCQEFQFQRPIISTFECDVARSNARLLVQAKWGVTVR